MARARDAAIGVCWSASVGAVQRAAGVGAPASPSAPAGPTCRRQSSGTRAPGARSGPANACKREGERRAEMVYRHEAHGRQRRGSHAGQRPTADGRSEGPRA
eukprot:6317584-Prymnesium_polylepis.2